MFKEPIEFLKHIADECEYLLSVNKELSKEDFSWWRDFEAGCCPKLTTEKYDWNEGPANSWLYRSELLDCLGVFKNKIPELYDQIQSVLKDN